MTVVRVLLTIDHSIKSHLSSTGIKLPISKYHLITGDVCTPIALHCGNFIFNLAVKAAEIGRFRKSEAVPFSLHHGYM